MYWKNDKPTSACFKHKEGLSVNRTWCYKFAEALEHLEIYFPIESRKAIISVNYSQCEENKVLVKYLPIELPEEPENIYHSELHRNITTSSLTQSLVSSQSEQSGFSQSS